MSQASLPPPAGIDPGQHQETIGFKLASTFLRLRKVVRLAFAAHGHQVTPEQWVVLNRLYLEDGGSQSELAERIFKDRPSTTRLLNNLEAQGLVVRGRDTSDRRRHRVYLTAQGRELREELYPAILGVMESMVADVDTEELQALMDGLDKLACGLEQSAQELCRIGVASCAKENETGNV